MFTRTESFNEFIRFYPAVTLIILFNLLIFLMTSLPILPGDTIFERLAGVNLYIMEGEVWRLATPIFVHSGFPHLLFNSFSLVLFGPALERMLGKAKFTAIYLLTGISANVATLFLEPMTYIHVGSSGAIFGLFGFYLAMILFRRGMLSKENSQTVMTIAAIGVIMTFVQPNINITAHIFGLIAGLLIGRLFLTKL
ncbi:rhomboid family intramembrane serine protease [Mesobacillus foraminis]|uniref:Membrane associated rhomboid family serine protease n=1 Tax=Mesobacillus foraminis TaxID=279826 RepID=A0A4R2AVM1_9BACI|nr:rhomboid family intramembrane serine protease [Mesobacillus foraminis]TCN18008.1 membrane associated rhomboid family serine protease [Mesobacillus foraminis]